MFSVVMIVRDEAAALPGALASVRGAPEVVICDTGSRDGTRDIARKAGARVVDYTWGNDFAAARTFAESHAAHDWIMRLDADERVVPCASRGLRAEDAIGIHQPRSSDFTAALCALLLEHDASPPVQGEPPSAEVISKVDRHRTAIVRGGLSKPVKLILDAAQLRPGDNFFDYGCGLGADVRALAALGYSVTGWDPVHAPTGEHSPSDVVNLGFVINVIEDPAERVEVLASA